MSTEQKTIYIGKEEINDNDEEEGGTNMFEDIFKEFRQSIIEDDKKPKETHIDGLKIIEQKGRGKLVVPDFLKGSGFLEVTEDDLKEDDNTKKLQKIEEEDPELMKKINEFEELGEDFDDPKEEKKT